MLSVMCDVLLDLVPEHTDAAFPAQSNSLLQTMNNASDVVHSTQLM